MSATRKAYRSAILHSIADPAEVGIEASFEYYEDGLLVVDNGQIIVDDSKDNAIARLSKPKGKTQ